MSETTQSNLPAATGATPHAERTQARVLALQYLYSRDVLKGVTDEDPETFFDSEGVAVKSVRDYADRLIGGVLGDQVRLDLEIQEAARNWSVGRMPAVDRNIVRICWFEMRTLEVPPAVAINEAIELGKEFSTENSGAFINGVLDQLHKARLNNPDAIDLVAAAEAAAAEAAAVAAIELAAKAAADALVAEAAAKAAAEALAAAVPAEAAAPVPAEPAAPAPPAPVKPQPLATGPARSGRRRIAAKPASSSAGTPAVSAPAPATPSSTDTGSAPPSPPARSDD